MEQPSPVSAGQPEEPKALPMSLAARLCNVLATPGDVFETVKAAPVAMANWLVPALLFIVVSWASAWLIFSQPAIQQQLNDLTEQAIQKQVERGHMSSAQAESARQMGEKYAGLSQKILAVVGPVFVAFASPFWWGLILWLLGAKVFKADLLYIKAVEVAGLANMVAVLAVIVKSLLIVGLGNVFVSPSLILFVKTFDGENTLHHLLAVFNVMTFWVLAVRALGLARLSGASFTKAAAWIFGIWAAYTGFFIGLGAATRLFFSHLSGNAGG